MRTQWSVAMFFTSNCMFSFFGEQTAPAFAWSETLLPTTSPSYKTTSALSARSREGPIALVASRERLGDLVQWCNRNKVYLKGRTYVTSSEAAELLLYNPETAHLVLHQLGLEEDESCPPASTNAAAAEYGGGDATTSDGTSTTTTSSSSFDFLLAAKIVKHEVSKVIYFANGTPSAVLVKACQEANLPLALNDATADVLIRDIPKHRVAYLFYNPAAGQTDTNQLLEQIYDSLEPHIPVTAIPTDPSIGVTQQAQDLVKQLQTRQNGSSSSTVTPLILACGGDGTVSAVAAATLGTGIPFGVIAGGTANAFAAALDIPVTLADACETILTGHTRLVDAATCNDEHMILLAGVGFEANMVEHAERGVVKKMLGPIAYVLGGAREIAQSGQNSFTCKLTVDGTPWEQSFAAQAVTVAVAAPAASVSAQGTGNVIPDDGLLDITIQTSSTVMESLGALASLVGAAFVQRPTETEHVLQFRARNVQLVTKTKQKVVVDGELRGAVKDFRFSVLPKALNVIAPPAADAAATNGAS